MIFNRVAHLGRGLWPTWGRGLWVIVSQSSYHGVIEDDDP